MRPPIDFSAITVLRDELPEFEDHYLDLVDIYDEDLTPEIVLMELADFVANLIVSGGGEETLERSLLAVEDVAVSTREGPELLAYSFLIELPLGSREIARSYFGLLTASLADLVWRGDTIDFSAPNGFVGEADPSAPTIAEAELPNGFVGEADPAAPTIAEAELPNGFVTEAPATSAATIASAKVPSAT
jgi:hypothetical protein